MVIKSSNNGLEITMELLLQTLGLCKLLESAKLCFISSLTHTNNEKWNFGIFIVKKNLLCYVEFTF